MTEKLRRTSRVFGLLAIVTTSLTSFAQNYVVGDRGFILKTTDRGKTWQQSRDSTSATNLDAVRIFGKDSVLVAGARDNGNSDIYRTLNGTNYRRVGGKNSALVRDVAMFANGQGTAIHRLYSTHPITSQRSSDFGASWTDDNSGLFAGTALDQLPQSNRAWAAWQAGRVIYRTTNSGNTWNQQFSIPAINSTDKTSKRTIMVADGGLAFAGSVSGQGFRPLALPGAGTTKLRMVRTSPDDSTVIVVGSNGYTARSTDGGLTWAQLSVGTADINFVEWASESIVFIGGAEDSQGELPIWKSLDGGANFTRIPLSAFGTRQKVTKNNFYLDMNGPLLGVMCSGWRGNGNENALYKTTDGGNTWQEYEGPFQNRNASIVKVFSTDTMIVSHFGTFGSGEIFMSTNGGTTFNLVGGDRGGKYGIYFTSRQEGYIAGEIGIWKTTNGGFSWTYITDPQTTSPLYDINKGVVVGLFGKALTTSDYNTFTPLRPLGYVAGTIKDIHVLDANTVFAAGDNGGIFRTTNGGTNWLFVGDTLKTGNIRSVNFPSVKYGWAVGENGLVYHTADSAKTWSSLNPTTRRLNDVHFLNDSVGVIVGDSGIALTTVDYGRSWSQIFVGTRANLNRAWMGDTLNQPNNKQVSFGADSAIAFAGEVVRVPVRVRDFAKIRQIQGAITWDTAVARFVSVQNFALPNLATRNFNTATAANLGMLRFAWSDTANSVADNDTLFTVSFRLKTAAVDSSLIRFNGSWLLGAVDSNRVTVPTNWTAGLLKVKPSPVVTVDTILLGAQAGATSVCAGGQISIVYTTSGAFAAGNTFLAQLSDANGSFGTVTTLGVAQTGELGDTITATLPSGVTTSDRYRVRVVASLPIVTSAGSADSIRIVGLPARPSITPSGSLVICPGDSLELVATAGAASYLWSNGATTQRTFVRGAGIHNVQAFTAEGCASQVSANITTTAGTQPAAPTITATGSTTRCEGDSVTLTAPNANAFRWSTGATTRSIVVKTTGAYTVQIRTSPTGCFSLVSNATNVTINPLPAAATITVLGASNDSLLASTSGATQYLWFRDGNRVTALTGQKVRWTVAGSYTVQVVVNGCTSAVSAPVVVTSVAGRIAFAGKVNLYPNPNNGSFNLLITGMGSRALTLSITDLAGRVLESSRLDVTENEFTTNVNTSGLAKGSYLVRLTAEDGSNSTIRMTVQ